MKCQQRVDSRRHSRNVEVSGELIELNQPQREDFLNADFQQIEVKAVEKKLNKKRSLTAFQSDGNFILDGVQRQTWSTTQK